MLNTCAGFKKIQQHFTCLFLSFTNCINKKLGGIINCCLTWVAVRSSLLLFLHLAKASKAPVVVVSFFWFIFSLAWAFSSALPLELTYVYSLFEMQETRLLLPASSSLSSLSTFLYSPTLLYFNSFFLKLFSSVPYFIATGSATFNLLKTMGSLCIS